MSNIISRKEYIDALRALAIVIVVYSHCVSGWTWFFLFIGPIMMPLFFEISGYVFKIRDGKWTSFFINLFKRVVVPWFFLVFFPVIISSPIRPLDKTLDFCYKYLSGETLWFIPCFIYAMIIHFFIQKCMLYINNHTDVWLSKVGGAILCILCSCVGFYMCENNILDFGMINRAMVVQFYFALGIIIKRMENHDFYSNISIIACVTMSYLLLVFGTHFLFPGEFIDVHLNNYFNIPYCLLLVLTGNISLFMMARYKNRFPRVTTFIGRNTLAIYLLHSWFFTAYDKLASYCTFIVTEVFWLDALFRASFAIVLSCLVAEILNRKLPVVIGLKK